MSSSRKNTSIDSSPPVIRIQSASPAPEIQETAGSSGTYNNQLSGLIATRRRSQSLPTKETTPNRPRQKRKRFNSEDIAENSELDGNMPSGSSSKHSSKSSRKHSSGSGSSSKKSKSSSKEYDWSDVADPEERRRIQNRNAQRKFREKARESKEKAERDSQNQAYAGNSYRTPSANDIPDEPELSGLPWGSVNFAHVVSRGHEAESRRSSGRDTFAGDDSLAMNPYGQAYGGGHWAAAVSYGGSNPGDDAYYDPNDAYAYDPTTQGR